MTLQTEIEQTFKVHSKSNKELKKDADPELQVEIPATQRRISVHKHRAKKTKKLDSGVQDTVHFGNDSWNLVLHMLFGIRQSVHSVQHDEVFKLDTAEFS